MTSAANPPAIRSASDYAPLVQAVLDPLIPRGSQVFLFDFPNYPNVGDSAIWLGEEAYLRTRKDVRTIAADERAARHGRLPALPSSAVVLIHGGGNLGDLWPHHQSLRETLIRHYQEHRIIQLPQSIHFEAKANEDRCRRVFRAHQDFHLLVRDHASLEWGQRMHTAPTYLCPDMALCLGRLPRTSVPRHDIVALLRTDKETTAGNASGTPAGNTVILDWLEETSSFALRLTEAVERLQTRYPRRMPPLHRIKTPLYRRVARERVKRGVDILSAGKVVITDRLHAHILCTLMGIPHVVLDNSYRKIGNFRDAWQTGVGLCESATGWAEAQNKAREFLHGSISNEAS